MTLFGDSVAMICFSCDDLFQFAVRVFLALPGFVMLGVQHFPSCEKQPSDPAKRVI